MATKTASIIIDVNDKSLVELNSEIKTLETSISKLKVGTNEWIKQNQKLGELKTQFNSATQEAQKLQNVIQKVGGAEQAKAFAKLGQGLVGAFAGFTGAIQLLGDGNKKFDEITAKATTFLQIMGGLNAVAETFSAENLKGLKSLSSSFTSLVSTVKVGSSAIKTALISTGIGALVVALGVAVAYWDEIKTAIFGVSQEQRDLLTTTQANVDAEQEKLSTLNNQDNILKLQGKTEKQILDLKIKQTEQAILALEINIANQKKVTELEIQSAERNKEMIKNILKYATAGIALILRAVDDIGKAFGKDFGLAEGLEGTTTWIAELFFDPEEIRKEGEGAVSENEKVLNDLKNQVAGYQLQIKGINQKAYEERKKQEKNYTEFLENELKIRREDYIRSIEDVNQVIAESYKELDKQVIIFEQNALVANQLLAGIITQVSLSLKKLNVEQQNQLRITQVYLNQIERNSELVLGSGQDALSIREKLNKQLELSKLLVDDQLGSSIQLAETSNQYVKDVVDGQKRILIASQLELLVTEEQYEAKNELLLIQDKLIKKERESNITRLNDLNEEKDVIYEQIGTLEFSLSLLSDKEKFSEKGLEIQRQIVKLGQEATAVEQDINDTKLQTLEYDNQIIKLTDESLKLNFQLEESRLNYNNQLNNSIALIEEQIKLYVQLQSFLQEYDKEIRAAQDTLFNSIELVATLLENKAQKAQERIDTYQEQLDNLNSEEQQRAQLLLDYEQELKDANGQRYDELLNLIELEKNAQIQAKLEVEALDKTIAEEEKKRNKAEYNAAVWRKAAAITQAVIDTALGVVEALPNLILAGIVAAAGATNIALISAQKIPTQGFAKGGFTGNGDNNQVAGVVHRGEYVAPAYVVNSSEGQRHIAALEAQRLRGYKDGGMVVPNNDVNSSMIDYDRLILGIANALSNLPAPEVSVVKITSAQREVKVTKQLAGLVR